MNWYKTSLFAMLLLGGFACKADNLLVGENGGAQAGGDPLASTGGASAAFATGGWVAMSGRAARPVPPAQDGAATE